MIDDRFRRIFLVAAHPGDGRVTQPSTEGVSSIPMLMREPFIIPYLESRPEIRENVQTMRGPYRRLVILMLDVVRGVDISAMIEEMHPVQRHSP